jgi:hypothetical protein
MYVIRMGIPEMKALWENLVEREKAKTLSKDETTLYKKWGKALAYLARDPRHPGLQSHEIDALSRRYGVKVWQSYLENRTASAARMYWVYGKRRNYDHRPRATSRGQEEFRIRESQAVGDGKGNRRIVLRRLFSVNCL